MKLQIRKLLFFTIQKLTLVLVEKKIKRGVLFQIKKSIYFLFLLRERVHFFIFKMIIFE